MMPLESNTQGLLEYVVSFDIKFFSLPSVSGTLLREMPPYRHYVEAF